MTPHVQAFQCRPLDARPRRGVALLLVLVALVLGVTAATVAASALAVRSLAERQRKDAAIAARGLAALDVAATEWLRTESRNVVLPPDVETPAVAILDEVLVLDGLEIHVRLTAYDQRGMIPWESAREGAAIAGGGWISDEVVDRIREATPSRVRADEDARTTPSDDEVVPGLDLLRVGFAPAFPSPSGEAHTTVRYGQASPATRSGGMTGGRSGDGPIAVGAIVATHARGEVRLNVNTAPISLLARASTLLQADVASAAAEARAAGRKATAPNVNDDASDGTDPKAIQFVAESDRWSILAEARVREARVATWSVHARGDRGWIVVQRLRADGGAR